MKKRNCSNLNSPNQIKSKIEISNLDQWFANELSSIDHQGMCSMLMSIINNIDDVVSWPIRAELCWEGCTRLDKYHRYTEELKSRAKEKGIYLDSRTNGPAIMAFQLAGGIRPKRYGSNNAWNIHHLYSGKFPYIGRKDTLHAVHDPKHFTQSAGLVSVHPITDAICDEYPFFTWFLRAKAFIKFGYDPDHVFHSGKIDENGFGCSERHS